MNLQELLKDIKKQATEDKSVKLFNQNEILNSGAVDIQRHTAAANATHIWIVPMMLQFPFNPLDLMDQTYSQENPYSAPGDPENVIILLKQAMREDDDLHKAYASYIGKTPDEYDISEDILTENDLAIFRKFRAPAQLSRDTQKVRTDDAGQYGKEFLSRVVKNEDGIDDSSKAEISVRLLDLETEICNEKMAEYLADKKRSSLTNDEKEALTSLRRTKQITYPRKSGILLFLQYDCDTNKEQLKEPKAYADLNDILYYVNCNEELLGKVYKKINKKKDSNISYIMLKVSYGDGKSKDQNVGIALAKSRDFEFVDCATKEDVLAGIIDEDIKEDPRPLYKKDLDITFDDTFREFNQKGLEGNYSKIASKAIFKFRPIKTEVLIALFKNRIPQLVPYITETIFDRFIDLFEIVNKDIAEMLTEKKRAKKLPPSFQDTLLNLDDGAEQAKKLDKANKLEVDESKGYEIGEEDVNEKGLDPEEVETKSIGDMVGGTEDEDFNVE